MGGFIKGIVVGVLSFGLGFAVLSVLFPVQEPPAVDAQGASQQPPTQNPASPEGRGPTVDEQNRDGGPADRSMPDLVPEETVTAEAQRSAAADVEPEADPEARAPISDAAQPTPTPPTETATPEPRLEQPDVERSETGIVAPNTAVEPLTDDAPQAALPEEDVAVDPDPVTRDAPTVAPSDETVEGAQNAQQAGEPVGADAAPADAEPAAPVELVEPSETAVPDAQDRPVPTPSPDAVPSNADGEPAAEETMPVPEDPAPLAEAGAPADVQSTPGLPELAVPEDDPLSEGAANPQTPPPGGVVAPDGETAQGAPDPAETPVAADAPIAPDPDPQPSGPAEDGAQPEAAPMAVVSGDDPLQPVVEDPAQPAPIEAAPSPEAASPEAESPTPQSPFEPQPSDPEAGLAPQDIPSDPDATTLATPETLPRVQPMPGGSTGVTVRRGGDGTPRAAQPEVEGVTVGRLPSIGATPDEDPTVTTNAAPETPGFDMALPAYLRYAALSEPLGAARPLGVVLFDDPSAEAAVLDLALSVTIAMDPFDPDAPRRAQAYRDAGHEIVLLARNIPPRATPSDLAVTLDAFFRSFPETVALMDVTSDPVASDRAVARELSLMLEPEGYGVIARRRGLDGFLQAAHDAGLAATGLYRVIDESGQSATTMRRLVDRAAFEAQRQDGILIAGSAANPETLAVLEDWAQQAGRDGVVLVPASAVLTSE